MKFSVRQILASAAGAVIAAFIASSFGVTGTIIGVAIGSMAATMGTAFVSQSIERGQKAVKQVAVRVPESSSSTLLRRLGGTGAAGAASTTQDAGPEEAAPTEVVGVAGDETTQMQSTAAPVQATQRLDVTAVAGAPPTEHLEATTVAVPALAGAASGGVAGAAGRDRTGVRIGERRYSWRAIAGTAAIVFVLALLFVTAIELIAGKPLSSIFGNTDNGPSISHIFNQSPATSSTTTTSTPSTTTTTSSSGTTTTSSTTSTTAPTTTTTTNPGATTTTVGTNSTSTTIVP